MKRFFFLRHLKSDRIWKLSGCNLLYCGFIGPVSLIEGEKHARKLVRVYDMFRVVHEEPVECVHMIARTWKSAYNHIRKLSKI